MGNEAIIEAAFHILLERARTGALDAGVPVVRKPDSWREDGIDLTYSEGYKVSLLPAGDDATRVELFDSAGRPLAFEDVIGYRDRFDPHDSAGPANELADLIEDVYRRALS